MKSIRFMKQRVAMVMAVLMIVGTTACGTAKVNKAIPVGQQFKEQCSSYAKYDSGVSAWSQKEVIIHDNADSEAFQCIAKVVGYRGKIEKLFRTAKKTPAGKYFKVGAFYGFHTEDSEESEISYIAIENPSVAEENDYFPYISEKYDPEYSEVASDSDQSDYSAIDDSSSGDDEEQGQTSTQEVPGDSWLGESSVWNVNGQWCRSDKKCIKILPDSDSSDTFTLDVSGLGDENPIPSGKTTVTMTPYYQSQPENYDEASFITQYSYELNGEIVEGKYAPGVISSFVEEPVNLYRVNPGVTTSRVLVDSQDPPISVAYIVIVPYGSRPVASNSSVFYPGMTAQ